MTSYKAQFFLFLVLSIRTVSGDWNDSDFRSVDGLQVDRIRFAYNGDKLVKNGVLRAAMRSKEGSPFVRQNFNEDLVTIVNLYQSRGYRSARIPRKRCQINSEGDRVRIRINIESGPLWYVKTLRVKT
ncbi:MAG: POTRA domain-containing protein, partial [Candidatus Latescibacterota bacterium]|nr:POTRA domain-containing protein [Candidatus Latescibacterota bacterium]